MIYLFDGAMGTMLHQAGLPAEMCPEQWNLVNPAAVTAIHRRYVESGADIIETNTLGANRIKLAHYRLDEQVKEINQAAVTAARAACGPTTKIAGSVGSTGKLIAPLGELGFEDAYAAYCDQIAALAGAGADMIIIETIIDMQEMRAALLAAKATTTIPVICQLTFGEDGRTVTGTDPATAAILLEAMGADIIGTNCSLGPEQLLPVVQALAGACNLPISAQPNAGMPKLINGQTVFPLGPVAFANYSLKLVEAGASYIGGCCGTTPEHIQALRAVLPATGHRNRPQVSFTALTSLSRTVFVGPGRPPAIIGERINPTGRKVLAAEIREGSFAGVKREALAQVAAGAAVLDVNMGVPGIDQATAMKQAVMELALLTDVPLAIDTTDPAALEAGLRAFPGRALINSVSAEPERLEKFLPLAKKYGAAVLCLPIGPAGVPATAKERVELVRVIAAAALAAGLRTRDLLLDPLVLTVAADEAAARETLATLRLYREQFGYPTAMGLSNISYGLPRRELLNSSFYAMALIAGLDAPILNPYAPMMRDTVQAAAALLGHDASGRRYSINYAATAPTSADQAPTAEIDSLAAIKAAVKNGEKESVGDLIRKALTEGHSPLTITDQALTAAMNDIGEAFGAGRCYLPQVLLSAETMRTAFLTIKTELPSLATADGPTVILATVKGDIHDLGKNIVAALLENNGFRVIDLGKDVPPETIVASALAEKAEVVGLCALMTTTLPGLDATIAALKASGASARTLVGGAVVTPEYAVQAGADAYAPDGVAAVNIARRLTAR